MGELTQPICGFFGVVSKLVPYTLINTGPNLWNCIGQLFKNSRICVLDSLKRIPIILIGYALLIRDVSVSCGGAWIGKSAPIRNKRRGLCTLSAGGHLPNHLPFAPFFLLGRSRTSSHDRLLQPDSPLVKHFFGLRSLSLPLLLACLRLIHSALVDSTNQIANEFNFSYWIYFATPVRLVQRVSYTPQSACGSYTVV